MRKYIVAMVLALFMSFVAVPSVSAAGEQKTILDGTVNKYKQHAQKWEPVIKKYAQRLFILLCAISIVFMAGKTFVRGNMGIGDFFSEFMMFGVTMGFFYWLLNNGPTIAAAVVNSMGTIGREASTDYPFKMTPSEIVTMGYNLLYDACAEFGKSDYSTGITVIVVALMICIVFGVIAAQMVVLLCASWILIYAGCFFLGFGGSSYTSDIAKNYFRTVLAQAVQVFVFCLLIGIGQSEIKTLTVGLRTTKAVTVPNYWSLGGLIDNPTKVVHSEMLTLSGMCMCLVFAVVLCILVSRVPGMIAGVINGSSISAMSFGSVGAAATSAAMVGAQVAGGGMALAAAYTQARSDVQSGNGCLSGAAGGMGSGLGGIMNTGVSMMGNLLSGGEKAGKESLQKSTAGGKMAAQIEAKGLAASAANGGSNGDGGGNGGGKGGNRDQSGNGPGAPDQSSGMGTDTAGGQDGPGGGKNGEKTTDGMGATSDDGDAFSGGGSISAGDGPMAAGGEESDPWASLMNIPLFGDDVKGPKFFGDGEEAGPRFYGDGEESGPRFSGDEGK